MDKVEKYIGILVFLVPGFIVSKIHEVLGNKKKYKSDLKTIVEILAYDILIFTIQAIVLERKGYTNIQQVVNKVGDFSFLLKLTACLLFISIIVGIVVAFLRPKYTGKAVNWIRKLFKKPPVNDNQVWDSIINMGPCFMKVYKNNQLICRGGIKSVNFSASDDKEILLDNEWLLDQRPDLFDEKMVQTYYNIDKDLVIKIYDPAKVIAESNECSS